MTFIAAFVFFMPGPLDAALAEAEAQAELQVSVTMSLTWHDGEAVVMRFDAQADEWTLLSGDPDALDNTGRQKLRNMKKEAAPGGLLYADYRPYLEKVEQLSATPDLITYRFVPPEAGQVENAAALEEAMVARILVDPAQNMLTTYRVEALTPFKPMVAAKLDEFVLEHRFERVLDGAPPLLTYMRLKARGERLFNKVDDDLIVSFTDHTWK